MLMNKLKTSLFLYPVIYRHAENDGKYCSFQLDVLVIPNTAIVIFFHVADCASLSAQLELD
jgi:hypothetical protein